MQRALTALLSVLLVSLAVPASAQQCVPFARELSGISIRGDAWTWWNAAAGHYERGGRPAKGAVLVFKKHGSMRYGHVSVVSRVVNSREVLVDHSNWAPVRTSDRGKVAQGVRVRDVSPRNDWTEVRVWHEPSQDYGVRVYPAYGFIYGKAAPAARSAKAAPAAPLVIMGKAPRMPKHYVTASLTVPAKPVRDAAAESEAFDDAAPAEVASAEGAEAAATRTAAIEEAPSQDVEVWAGDREAADRAGSGRY
jgi:surface antigen